MPTGPAARANIDATVHGLPPVLTPGPGCFTCLIGFMPAWRGVPLAAVAALQASKAAVDTAINAAVATTSAAAGTPGAPAAYAAEQATKSAALASMGAAITATGADIHMCTFPSPVPPHGPGVDVTPSATVSIGFFPAGRMGDTLLEAIGPSNTIMAGEFTVIIGG